MQDLIYLDNNSTTPLDPRVFEAMKPYFTELYGNASSNHKFGVEINQAVKKAREQVAHLIGSETHEIVFTSGATESINTAIKGVVEQYKEKGNHIVTVATEHPAVLDTCRYLEKKGVEVTYLPVDQYGLVDLDEVRQVIKEDTLLVSVMLVNNETGVIQPIKEIAEIAHEKGVFFMTDATQAVGKMPVDVNELGIDLMAFSGHKFYGPKGIGGLFIRNGIKVEALIHGGNHQKGFRSGTLNVPGIIGLGKATEIELHEMENNKLKVRGLKDELEKAILSMPNTFLNGHPQNRLYNVANICFEGIDNEALLLNLNNICVSNGSACSSYSIEPSHVLLAMGLSKENANSSLRFSLGKFNTKEEIKEVVAKLKQITERLKTLSVS